MLLSSTRSGDYTFVMDRWRLRIGEKRLRMRVGGLGERYFCKTRFLRLRLVTTTLSSCEEKI
jgi:hypothetical protein